MASKYPVDMLTEICGAFGCIQLPQEYRKKYTKHLGSMFGEVCASSPACQVANPGTILPTALTVYFRFGFSLSFRTKRGALGSTLLILI